jgi:hypothetical protein
VEKRSIGGFAKEGMVVVNYLCMEHYEAEKGDTSSKPLKKGSINEAKVRC